MKIIFLNLSNEPKDESKYFSKGSFLSARRLWNDLKVDYITSKHISFSVLDKVIDSTRSVIYFSEKEFPKSWNCECKWFSIKNKFCKHILAVFLRLEKDEKFLKKFEKEER